MSNVQTDNSNFEVKVKLRNDNLPPGKCRVLDCYGGTGRIWETIKKRNPKKKIEVLRIDKKKDRGGVYLVGDNRKFMEALEPGQFDVIDLDAYGIPYKPLIWLFERSHGHPTTIFATFIQSLYGCLPTDFLVNSGYSHKMIKKCPSLFYRDGFEKLKGFLANKGVKKIKHYSDKANRKHYICFTIKKAEHKD